MTHTKSNRPQSPKLIILNTRDIKSLNEKILAQFSADFDFSPYAVLKNNEDKIFLVTMDIARIDLCKLRINSMGIYFGKIEDSSDSGLRLSIEGSQLIGPHAKKNVVEVSKEQTVEWMAGRTVSIDLSDKKSADIKGHVIMRFKEDFLGCGKIIKKHGPANNSDDVLRFEILNYVSKGRRIKMHDGS